MPKRTTKGGDDKKKPAGDDGAKGKTRPGPPSLGRRSVPKSK